MGTTYLEITRDQAHTLYQDVQIFSDFGHSSHISPWWSPEMSRMTSHRHKRNPAVGKQRDIYKWYIEVHDDGLS